MQKLASQLKQQLKMDHLGLTASEYYGLIVGILCAGNRDDSLFSLLEVFANNSESLSQGLTQLTQQIREETLKELTKNSLDLEGFLEIEPIEIGVRIQNLIDWVNHFLLGMGIVQLKLSEFTGEKQEAIHDLKMIGQLHYSEEEMQLAETPQALQEIIEYVVTLACYLESQLTLKETKPLPC